MSKFRDMLQKFAAVHASTFNHVSFDRHLDSRSVDRQNRSAALAEWRHWRREVAASPDISQNVGASGL